MGTSVIRDVVVAAASAGGVEALQSLVSRLPADLEAAVVVVLHVPATGGRALPGILDRAGPLHAAVAADGEPLRHGRIYVAPPDRHILISDGVLNLSHGPRYNGHRPAADPLFRSAAAAAGDRVIGVVLSGTLDDGADGAAAIEKECGVVVIQDPAEAAYDGMPKAALAAVDGALVLPVAEIAAFIVEQSRTPAEPPAPELDPAPPRDLEMEALMETEVAVAADSEGWSGLTCPECGGPLQHTRSRSGDRYQCRVGHAWSQSSLLEDQSSAVERALWVAVLRLDERVRITRKMASDAEDRGHTFSAGRFREAAAEADEAATTIRGLLEQAMAADRLDTGDIVP